MQTVASYVRLLIASWMFMGGLAVLFLPTAEGTARNARWRERQLASVPEEGRAAWVQDRDAEDSRAYAAVRLFGVMIGGLGLTGALRETAYLVSRENR